MEMWRLMVTIVHRDNNAEEAGDFWHIHLPFNDYFTTNL
jgi:hypothetical protein